MAFHTRLAGELGADLIKTDILPNEQDTAEVVSTSLVPILLAGGSKTEETSVINLVQRLVRAGASGIISDETSFSRKIPPRSYGRRSAPYMNDDPAKPDPRRQLKDQ